MTARSESSIFKGHMYQSRNTPDLATKNESTQDFLEDQDNDKDLETPMDDVKNDDVTGGDDID
eukprot:7107263-Ditylum_brightwellii.AAC.1